MREIIEGGFDITCEGCDGGYVVKFVSRDLVVSPGFVWFARGKRKWSRKPMMGGYMMVDVDTRGIVEYLDKKVGLSEGDMDQVRGVIVSIAYDHFQEK